MIFSRCFPSPRLTLVLFTAYLSAISACDCSGGGSIEVTSQLLVDVCKSPEIVSNGKRLGGDEDCELAFGNADITVRQRQRFTISNPSQVDIKIKNLFFRGEYANNFTVENKATEEQPLELKANQQLEIVVTARTLTEGDAGAELIILSDADNGFINDKGQSEITIQLTLNGIDNGVPDLEITLDPGCQREGEPKVLDFKNVAITGSRTCDVTFTNKGVKPLTLDRVYFSPIEDGNDALFLLPDGSALADPFQAVGRLPTEADPIEPEAHITVSFRFTPDVLGNYQAKLSIDSNDPDEFQESLDFFGRGSEAPTCKIRIASVNGVPVNEGENPVIAPLDDVELTAEDSTPSNFDGQITRYEWRVLNSPDGSHVTPTTPSAVRTQLQFNGGPNGTFVGVDLVGRYLVAAQVYDEDETPSVNDCVLEFEAIPKDSFLVQLTWDTPDTDVDLHFSPYLNNGVCAVHRGESNSLEDDCQSDCYYGSECNATSNEYVFNINEPSLDIDDTNGFGPENTNVDEILPGKYLIGVHYFRIDIDTVSTVRVYVFGLPWGEFIFEADNKDFVDVAILHWPADTSVMQPCLEDLLDDNPTDDCGDI
jgi:hypothetical protein